MFKKGHLEQILRINGLTHDSSDEEIRKTIGYAKGQNLDEALALLREEKVGTDSKQNTKPDFQSNFLAVEGRLRPDSIKKMLGIDLEVKYEKLNKARAGRKNVSIWQILGIAVCSLLVALIAGILVMKHYQINLFLAFIQK